MDSFISAHEPTKQYTKQKTNLRFTVIDAKLQVTVSVLETRKELSIGGWDPIGTECLFFALATKLSLHKFA